MRFGVCLAAWMPGHPGHGQHVALGDGVAGHHGRGLGLHHHLAPGQGPPVGGLLGGDVDHAGPAQGVEMGQATVAHGGQESTATRRLSRRSGSCCAVGPDEVDLADRVAGPLAADVGRRWPRPGRRRTPPARRSARRSVSRMANRQLRNMPSAVRRTRSQVAAEALGDAGDRRRSRPRRRRSGSARPAGEPRWADRLQRVHGADGGQDLGRGHDLLAGPRPVGVEGHELDEADDDAPSPGRRWRSRPPRRR